MPPVNKAGGAAFRKDVDFVTKDEQEQVASGIVMVPDKADLQNDFAREDTIRNFSDQFETFEEAGQAGGGIMHAVWPDGWMELERNEVLTESEEIGGQTVDAGSWVQDWSIENDQLWNLIDDDILEGYSIGAIQVDWNGPYDQDDAEVDDVEVPDEIDEDELIWELTDGIIREVSAVDIPAVPDAQILEAKSEAMKRLQDHVGNQDAFIEEAMERGHSEPDAQDLWDVLNAAMEAAGSGDPGKQTVFARAGKAFLSALTGRDDEPGDLGRTSREDTSGEDPRASKEGRTLSKPNRDSLMASIDASLDVLHDAGVDHGMTRFTDREDTNFDLSEHTAREWPKPDDEDDEGDEEEEEENAKDATGGDTPDDTETMTDDNGNTDDPMEDAPKWAQSLHESIEENSKRIDEQREQVEAALEEQAEEKTAQIEIGGEVYEVTESEAKAWFEDGEEPDADPMDDAPDHIRALDDRIEETNQRIERINEQSGLSDQIDPSRTGKSENGDADGDGLDALSKVLS